MTHFCIDSLFPKQMAPGILRWTLHSSGTWLWHFLWFLQRHGGSLHKEIHEYVIRYTHTHTYIYIYMCVSWVGNNIWQMTCDVISTTRLSSVCFWHFDDSTKWNRSPRCLPLVRGIHRLLAVSPTKAQYRISEIFVLVWATCWINNQLGGDLSMWTVDI